MPKKGSLMFFLLCSIDYFSEENMQTSLHFWAFDLFLRSIYFRWNLELLQQSISFFLNLNWTNDGGMLKPTFSNTNIHINNALFTQIKQYNPCATDSLTNIHHCNSCTTEPLPAVSPLHFGCNLTLPGCFTYAIREQVSHSQLFHHCDLCTTEPLPAVSPLHFGCSWTHLSCFTSAIREQLNRSKLFTTAIRV